MQIDLEEVRSARQVAAVFAQHCPYLDEVALKQDNFVRDRFRVKELTAWLVWSDDRTLYEFRLESHEGVSGYVICSPDDDLPPILEYGFGPRTATENLFRAVSANFSEIPPATHRRFIYASGLELYLEVDDWLESGRKCLFLNPISLRRTDQSISLPRDPASYWTSSEVEVARQKLFATAGASPPDVVILKGQPIRYQQDYSAYDAAGEKLPTACIAGCAPVAWAMLESAYATWDASIYSKVYRNQQDWKTEWPTLMEPDPSRSDTVRNRIWAFHRVMATTCGGTTVWNGPGYDPGRWNIAYHPFNDFVAKWGLGDHIAPGCFENPSFADLKEVAREHGPFILCGTGIDAILLPRLTDGEGHCVVGYGYDSQHSLVRICLGWGTWVDDKWISPASVRQSLVIYTLLLR